MYKLKDTIGSLLGIATEIAVLVIFFYTIAFLATHGHIAMAILQAVGFFVYFLEHLEHNRIEQELDQAKKEIEKLKR